MKKREKKLKPVTKSKITLYQTFFILLIANFTSISVIVYILSCKGYRKNPGFQAFFAVNHIFKLKPSKLNNL